MAANAAPTNKQSVDSRAKDKWRGPLKMLLKTTRRECQHNTRLDKAEV